MADEARSLKAYGELPDSSKSLICAPDDLLSCLVLGCLVH